MGTNPCPIRKRNSIARGSTKDSFFLRSGQTCRKTGTQSYRVFAVSGDSQLPKE